MEPTDLAALERRFRRTYELGRLKYALLGFVPMSILVVVAIAFGARPKTAVVLAPFLLVGGVIALWYGREPGRGVLPGSLAGGLALVLALCANHMGHLCTGERCLSWCVPACVASGVIGGGLISFIGVRQRRGVGYWASASGITLVTGALGCSCVGYSGMLGLAVGLVAVLGFTALASAATRRAGSSN